MPSPLSIPTSRRSAVKIRGSWQSFGIVSLAVLLALSASAVTLNQLKTDPRLTPKKFAGHFEEFRYELHHEVQPITTFLAKKIGDCDDYACLADEVLPRMQRLGLRV